MLLKFVNLTDKNTEITFNCEYTYSSNVVSKPDKSTFRVSLNPKEIKQGECDTPDKAFVFFSKQLNFVSTEVKKFELKNVSVKTIQ